MKGPYDVTWGQYFVIVGIALAIFGVVSLIQWWRARRRRP